MEILLEVKDLAVKFKSQGNIVYAVNNLSFKVYENEILGIIGGQVGYILYSGNQNKP